MSELDSIITVSISRTTTVPTRVGFGFGNFLSNNAVFSQRIKSYASSAEVVADTLSGADTILFASKYFGQTIRPTKLFVTKKGRTLPSIFKLTVSADFVTSNSVAGTIDGVAITPVVFSVDHSTTMTALAAEIAGETTVDTATVTAAREITITSFDSVGNAFTAFLVTLGASQPTISFSQTQYADTVLSAVASLEAAETINNDWYGLAAYDHSEATINLIAAYTQSRTKLYFASSSDAGILTTSTTDIASDLKLAGYDRSSLLYSADAANFPEGAWMGGLLPKDPGSATFAFKPLSGITVDTLTTDEQSNVLGKNGNIYIAKGGVSHTEFGTTGEGEFIDVMWGADFIQIRIQEEVYTKLVNESKVPYTNAGVAVIENAIRKVLTLATNQGILAADPAYEVSVPDVADISVVDKGVRFLPDITFKGTLAGAIHKVSIAGVLTL